MFLKQILKLENQKKFILSSLLYSLGNDRFLIRMITALIAFVLCFNYKYGYFEYYTTIFNVFIYILCFVFVTVFKYQSYINNPLS